MVALRTFELFVDFLLKGASIEKPRERIDLGLVFEMLLILDDAGAYSYAR